VKFLFDTDHISFLQRRSGSEYVRIAARIATSTPGDFAFSVVSLHEQVLGANAFINRAQTSADTIRGYNTLLEILQGFSVAPVLPFDTVSAAIFDGLRAQRVRIATMDLRIASIALGRDLIVLTRNTRDFNQVPGLITQDWTID
jgi:tRNA(fMet)-specific endonuclease VapC